MFHLVDQPSVWYCRTTMLDVGGGDDRVMVTVARERDLLEAMLRMDPTVVRCRQTLPFHYVLLKLVERTSLV